MQVLLRNGRRVLIIALVGVLLISGAAIATLSGQFAPYGSTEITVADAFAIPKNDPSQIADPSVQNYPPSDDTNVDCGPASTDATAPPAAHLIGRLGCA